MVKHRAICAFFFNGTSSLLLIFVNFLHVYFSDVYFMPMYFQFFFISSSSFNLR